MTRRIQLRQFCHSRTGDKGDSLTLSLIPYDPAHFDFIQSYVTAERVQQYFDGAIKGAVERYELPKIAALNFVVHRALGGGSTKTLRRDLHGKALSGVFLDMEVEVPDDFRLPEMT